MLFSNQHLFHLLLYQNNQNKYIHRNAILRLVLSIYLLHYEKNTKKHAGVGLKRCLEPVIWHGKKNKLFTPTKWEWCNFSTEFHCKVFFLPFAVLVHSLDKFFFHIKHIHRWVQKISLGCKNNTKTCQKWRSRVDLICKKHLTSN